LSSVHSACLGYMQGHPIVTPHTQQFGAYRADGQNDMRYHDGFAVLDKQTTIGPRFDPRVGLKTGGGCGSHRWGNPDDKPAVQVALYEGHERPSKTTSSAYRLASSAMSSRGWYRSDRSARVPNTPHGWRPSGSIPALRTGDGTHPRGPGAMPSGVEM
jgi:hypothetical protein